jgi:hypothetical protein
MNRNTNSHARAEEKKIQTQKHKQEEEKSKIVISDHAMQTPMLNQAQAHPHTHAHSQLARNRTELKEEAASSPVKSGLGSGRVDAMSTWPDRTEDGADSRPKGYMPCRREEKKREIRK